MFGGSCGDRFLLRIVGRRSFTNIYESNPIFWEYTGVKKEKSHVMVTLKGWFKIETGYKWNILALLYITDSGIKVSRWGYLDGVCWNIHTSVMLKWIY